MIEWVSMVGWGRAVFYLLISVGVLGILAFGILRVLRKVAELYGYVLLLVADGSPDRAVGRECRERQVHDVVAINEALADRNRLRMLSALRGRELAVCQIAEFLGLPSSAVSKQMSVLQRACLVTSREDRKCVCYRLARRPVCPGISRAVNWTLRCVSKTREAEEDAGRLRDVLGTDLQEVCRRQKEGRGKCV